jgi:hypothetical protein
MSYPGFFASMILTASLAFAGPAAAFIEAGDLDPYNGKRILDVADPLGGPLAPDKPAQGDLEEEFSIEWEDYTVTAVQGFGIEALVLGKKDYTEGDMGALVPIDLALAWGKASDPAWVKHLRVTQGERLYRWSFPRGTPLKQEVVEYSSANMHIMPATPEIREKLSTLGKGDVVQMTGFLVNITKEDGYEWLTSLVRTDTGLGACEVILVESVEIKGR